MYCVASSLNPKTPEGLPTMDVNRKGLSGQLAKQGGAVHL